MTNHASPLEDAATAIAATVRAKGWHISRWEFYVYLAETAGGLPFVTLCCKDASQAKRLAEMMRDK